MNCEFCGFYNEDFWCYSENIENDFDINWDCENCMKTNINYIKLIRHNTFGYGGHGGGRILEETNGDGKWGYIDSSGNMAIPFIYDTARDFHEGVASVSIGHKWGLIDKTGKFILSLYLSYIDKFINGVACARKNKLWGLIDKTGKEIIPFIYDYTWFEDGVIIAQLINNKKIKFFDYAGNETEDPYFKIQDECARIKKCVNRRNSAHDPHEWLKNYNWENYDEYYNGLICVERKDGKEGLFDKTGNELLPFLYKYISIIDDDMIKAKKDGSYGYINKNGDELVPFIYQNTGDLHENRIPVEMDGKWGFINKAGKIIIPLIYDAASSFKNGLACVKINNNEGLIDIEGNIIVPFIYSEIYDFDENNLACIEKQFKNKSKNTYKYGLIDKTGKKIIPNIYNIICEFREGLSFVKLNEKWGVIDVTGNKITAPVYDDFGHYSEGLARVKICKT